MQQAVTNKVQHLGVATVGMAIVVFANPVNPGHIAQVFNGTGRQQAVPGITAYLRPAGQIKQQVGSLCITTPYWKAQVIANQRPDAPSLQLQQQAPVTRDRKSTRLNSS